MDHCWPELVIFDCDGVLVDSEMISVSVLTSVVREAGGEIDNDAIFGRFLGRSMASVADTLRTDFDVTITAEHLSEIRRRLFARFARELEPIPGVIRALAGIRSPFCVASSSQVERILLSLELTGLLEFFDTRIYSSSMVENGKPAPDLFLHAAKANGARPERCLVIEDSSAGIMAARNAGMSVFAFVGGSHAGPAGLAREAAALAPDAIFDNMAMLPELILAHAGMWKAD